jgi:hypothetical protein
MNNGSLVLALGARGQGPGKKEEIRKLRKREKAGKAVGFPRLSYSDP